MQGDGRIDGSAISGFHRQLLEAPPEDHSAIIEAFTNDIADQLPNSLGGGTEKISRTNLLEQAGKLVAQVLPVSAEEYSRRLATCMDCDQVRVLFKGGGPEDGQRRAIVQCTQCSCVMNVKATLKSGKCPLGKY